MLSFLLYDTVSNNGINFKIILFFSDNLINNFPPTRLYTLRLKCPFIFPFYNRLTILIQNRLLTHPPIHHFFFILDISLFLTHWMWLNASNMYMYVICVVMYCSTPNSIL